MRRREAVQRAVATRLGRKAWMEHSGGVSHTTDATARPARGALYRRIAALIIFAPAKILRKRSDRGTGHACAGIRSSPGLPGEALPGRLLPDAPDSLRLTGFGLDGRRSDHHSR